MQDWDMVMSRAIDHAAREHGDREIVTHWADGTTTRTSYSAIRHDAKRLAQALRSLGIQKGDRVGTLAMNHAHHLVSWYGIVGAGGVVHTINPRLFADQLTYIVNHAEDRVLLYDAAFAPLVEKLKPHWSSIEHLICFDDGAFEALLADHDGDCEWTPVDERDPCMLCYTSGTTGDPKGVLYEHRSNMLHSIAGLQPSIFGFETRSVMLPVVPMFHANAWGIPWAAPMTGAKLVFSAINEAAVLLDLMEQEGVTITAGVPTVWMAIFAYLDKTGRGLSESLSKVIIGGAAPPPAMVRRLLEAGVEPAHAWGMTETSPVGTVTMLPIDWDNRDLDQKVAAKTMQGKAPFGVEIRCVDLDDPSRELPRDGKTSGALQVRGPWIVRRYFKAEEDSTGPDQWFDTGDVAVIHPDGTLQLTDRTKDLIKSGGEWISSVELENAAAGHPGVAEAAAFGIPDPKWTERPVLALVRKPGQSLTAEEILEFLSDKVAKWWLPDTVYFLDEIPHTATGKVSKKTLREQFASD
jgi:fatty-acyl-CoA synthase